jgi:hypothetical protein
MASYRDDRESLRQRLSELEEELARVRDASSQEDVRKEIATLSARIAEATAKLDSEREGLAEVGARIDALRLKLGPPADVPEEPARVPAPEPVPQPNRAMWAGIGALVLFCTVGVLWLSGRSRDTAELPESPPVPGAPHEVDPIASLSDARKVSGEHRDLQSIEIRYVKSDGRVDLEGPGYSGTIKYVFMSQEAPEPAPDPSRPLGAPQPTKPMSTQVTVRIERKGIWADPVSFPGMGERVSDPRCSIVDVWKAAIGAGVPKDAVAILLYQESTTIGVTPEGRMVRRSGPTWHFRVEGTSHDLDIDDPSCTVIKTR